MPLHSGIKYRSEINLEEKFKFHIFDHRKLAFINVIYISFSPLLLNSGNAFPVYFPRIKKIIIKTQSAVAGLAQ